MAGKYTIRSKEEKLTLPHILCEGVLYQSSSFVFRARYNGRLVMAPSFR